MRWFLDTEFHEDGRTIDLISIGLVNEAGELYYAVSTEFEPERCSDWVKENVLPKLPPRTARFWKSHGQTSAFWKPRAQIAEEIRVMLLPPSGDKPEIWAYFADYDWVALCQLYGRMIDLPKGFPMWCRDLKQLMQEQGIEKKDLPAQPDNAHDALADAEWVRAAYRAICTRKTTD